MREGKLVDFNDPIYMLDPNRGTCRVPTTSGNFLIVTNLKKINRAAYDAHYVDIKYKDETFRVQLDELSEALKYA